LDHSSAEGLAVKGFYIENIMYMNTAAFSIEYGIPISVFGDAISLTF